MLLLLESEVAGYALGSAEHAVYVMFLPSPPGRIEEVLDGRSCKDAEKEAMEFARMHTQLWAKGRRVLPQSFTL